MIGLLKKRIKGVLTWSLVILLNSIKILNDAIQQIEEKNEKKKSD